MTRRLRCVSLAVITAVTAGCGLDEIDLSDVYPNNCGREGSVELFDVALPEPSTGWLDAQVVGEYVLVEWSYRVSEDDLVDEYWAVDRCGERRVQLASQVSGGTVRYGFGGGHLLSCDEATGAIHWLDPDGRRQPRLLFPSAQGCRVVPFGRALAAQASGGSTVYHVADPSDSASAPGLVTDRALVQGYPTECEFGMDLACETRGPQQLDLQAAGDELLVVLDDERLAGFTLERGLRVLDEGPVTGVEVFGDDVIGVSHHLAPDGVRNLLTDEWFEMCCVGNTNSMERFGDWMVRGSWGAPTIPPPDEWTNFRALHLPSGARNEVVGAEDWDIVGAVGPDAVLVDIGPAWESEEARYVVRPATGDRNLVVLPGGVYSVPGWPGALAYRREDDYSALRHLAGPDAWPRTLLEDVSFRFVTPAGHIVFTEPDESNDGPLSVMLPDESIVSLDDGRARPFGYTQRDEVLYRVEDGDRLVLRRTVLPRVGE